MKLINAGKITFEYAVPMIGARIIGTSMGFIGMLMIAHLGHKQLAAGALISSISMTLFVIFWAFLLASGVIVASHFSQKKYEEIGEIVRQIWILSTVLAIPLTLIFLSVGPILLWFGQDKSLVLMVSQYFHVLVWAVYPSLLFVGTTRFITAVKKPKIVLYLALTEFITMILLGYGLVFGKFGLPFLGMVGMAYANVIAYWIGAIVTFLCLLYSSYFKKFNIFFLKKPISFEFFKKILMISFPIGIQVAAELTAFSFTTLMIGWLGESSLAAQQIVMQLGYVVLMIPYGISQASSILIAHAIGQKEFDSVRNYGNAAQILGLFFVVLIAIFYISEPNFIISCFGIDIKNLNNAPTIHIATLLLLIVAFSQILDAVRNIATGTLRAFHDTKIPMIVGFIASWGISVPFGYVMAFWFHWGAAGVSAGYLFGWAFSAIILIKRFYILASHENLLENH